MKRKERGVRGMGRKTEGEGGDFRAETPIYILISWKQRDFRAVLTFDL